MNYFIDKPTSKEAIKNFSEKFLQSKILLYCVIFLLVLKIFTSVISVNFPKNIFFADITKSMLVNLVNQTREANGIKPLVENQKLDQAAQLKAENMVANNYFAHTSPTGITPWYWFLQAGYNYKYAGENLAIGFYDSAEVFNAWLNSPSHRANIINPNYTQVGTAVLGGFGQNNTIIVVQDFGSQLPAKSVATKVINAKTIATQPKTNPVAKTNEPAPVANNNEKVLSQSTESNVSIENTKTGGSSIYYKIMNAVLYDYKGLLQNIIYGVSLIVIGILLTMIFININGEFKKELVFRAILVVILLSLATAVNKELIIFIIPHQIII